MGLFDRFLGKQKTDTPTQTQTQKKKRMSDQVNRPQPERVNMEMGSLRSAVEEAQDTNNPSWEKLYNIYKNIVKDSQVITQSGTAVNKLKAAPFVVEIDGNENEDLTDLFRRPWFAQFLKCFFDAWLWGYTIIEFGQQNEKRDFKSCKTFPRFNVYPHNRNIIIESTDTSGIPIGDDPTPLFLFEIGETDDLGQLEAISREVIWKTFSRQDWAEHSEKWGQPRIIMKTDTDDDKELDKKERAAANFARNGYMVTDIEDEIEKLESSSAGNGYLIYEKNIRLCNEEIAKLINGQTGTSDDMAYVGAAEVHERVMDDYHASRLRELDNIINFRLFDFLRYHGYQIPENAKFRFPELDPKTAKEKDDAVVEDPDEEGKKKKPGRSVSLANVKAESNPLESWLKRFFKGIAGVDYEMWLLNFESLVKSIEEAGLEFTTDYQYAQLAEELRANAASFAAFKNHNEQAALRDLLTDKDGKPVSWNKFKKAAQPITEQYNKRWLKTEYDQAVANAQMAVKWEGFAENADLYPNLEYRAVGDSKTRPEHAKLDGTILPITDKFWNKYYPPNGWGCRCSVTQTDKEPTKEPEADKPDKGFDFNPGIDKKLFADSNGYQADVDKKESKKITDQANKYLDKYLKS